MRKQEEFLDLITLAVPDGREVATISFWDHEGNTQAYCSSDYPEVLKILRELLDGLLTLRRVMLSARPFKGSPARGHLKQRIWSNRLLWHSGYRLYEMSV